MRGAMRLLPALLLVGAICWVVLSFPYQWSETARYWPLFLSGWVTTLWISAVSFVGSLFFGVLCLMMRRSRFIFLRDAARLYVELVRGTPLLVQLLFFFYGVSFVAQIENRYLAGVLVLSLFTGAYLSEVFRAGLEAIPPSQAEAGLALGLTRTQLYRYVLLPQAARLSLPATVGQLVSLVKDSSLLSILGIRELTYSAQLVSSATYGTLESFFPLAVGYLVITYPVSFLGRYLERRLRAS